MIATADLSEFQLVSPEPREMGEGGQVYIYLPALKLPSGCSPAQTDALLCLSQHSGYPTRLFLAHRVNGRGQNWNTYRILDREWHSWSWNHIRGDRRPMEILAEHLRGLR
jgi:hypothetical protein